VTGTIKHGRNLARDAHTASGIFSELAHAGLGYDYFRHSVSRFLVSGTGFWGPLPLLVKLVISRQFSVVSDSLPAGSY
jgi:hypothetical protein